MTMLVDYVGADLHRNLLNVKSRILRLLIKESLSAQELRAIIECRHETIYLALAGLEAQGLVHVWARQRPGVSVWSRAEVSP